MSLDTGDAMSTASSRNAPAPNYLGQVSVRCCFFLPIGVLSRVFRGEFVVGFCSAFDRDALKLCGELLHLAYHAPSPHSCRAVRPPTCRLFQIQHQDFTEPNL